MMTDPTEAGRYEWTGSQLVITHCIHGLDLRLYPRCYLCRPEIREPGLDVERLARALEAAGVSSDMFNAESDAAAIASEYAALASEDQT